MTDDIFSVSLCYFGKVCDIIISDRSHTVFLLKADTFNRSLVSSPVNTMPENGGDIMEHDAFTQGTEPEGLKNRNDIGILICYLLNQVGKPFPKDDLVELIQENGFANYFETTNSISELIKNGNIEYSDEKCRLLRLTKNGRLIVTQLHSNLSLLIRQRAAAAASQMVRRRKNESQYPVEITRIKDGGYQVVLHITDGLRDLMTLSVYVPSITEAKAIKRSFHKNPERLYSVMLAAVIGEKDMIEDALEELKK